MGLLDLKYEDDATDASDATDLVSGIQFSFAAIVIRLYAQRPEDEVLEKRMQPSH